MLFRSRQRTIYLLTLLCPTSMPSLRSSPWIRSAPQPGFSRQILRIRSRTSLEMTGRPGFPQRTFQVQNKRKAARCQAMTVSGLTMGPWPTPSANRARGATGRSTAGGRPRSILGAFLQTSGARRFDGVKPGSRARGKHATGRSTTELRGVS